MVLKTFLSSFNCTHSRISVETSGFGWTKISTTGEAIRARLTAMCSSPLKRTFSVVVWRPGHSFEATEENYHPEGFLLSSAIDGALPLALPGLSNPKLKKIANVICKINTEKGMFPS